MHPCPANRARRNQWPVKNQTIQVGNYTLMHSWRLRRRPPPLPGFSSCMSGAGTETRSVTRAHVYSQPRKPTRLVLLPLPAGAVHAPIQPVSRMSLKAPPSLLRLLALFCYSFFFFLPPPPPPKIFFSCPPSSSLCPFSPPHFWTGENPKCQSVWARRWWVRRCGGGDCVTW